MLNTSKRFVSTVVDRDRVSVVDVGKEHFQYSKIPTEDIPAKEICKYTETVYFLKAIANDRKRLYPFYFCKWIDCVNAFLKEDKLDFRVYGQITPDYRYKVIKYTVVKEEDRIAFEESKQEMLEMLVKYQREKFASGTYEAVLNAGIEPSIIEVIECPYNDYLGFIRSDHLIITVPSILHDQIWKPSKNIEPPAWIKNLVAEYIEQYGVDYFINENTGELDVFRPEIINDENYDAEGGIVDG